MIHILLCKGKQLLKASMQIIELLITKNNALFKSCISKMTITDNAEYHDIIMLIYNPLEYMDNYSMKLGSLWNYYRDEVNHAANENNDHNNRINNKK